MSNPFTEKDRKQWNVDLRDLSGIMDDIERAKKANIPGIEEVEDLCKGCIDGITGLKKQYFPNKP